MTIARINHYAAPRDCTTLDRTLSLASAPPEIQEALKAAPDSALPAIKVTWRNSGVAVNGWKINLTAIGTYGADKESNWLPAPKSDWPSRKFWTAPGRHRQ